MFSEQRKLVNLIDKFFQKVDSVNGGIGKATSYLILISVFTISYEVIARYFFNSPTKWSTELNINLLCAYVFLGGGYTLLHENHVRVDIFLRMLSEKNKAVCDLITSPLFFVFVITLIWKGCIMTARSFLDGTTSCESMEWPLYPSQLLIPLGGLLLGLQGLAKLWRDIKKIVEKDGE